MSLRVQDKVVKTDQVSRRQSQVIILECLGKPEALHHQSQQVGGPTKISSRTHLHIVHLLGADTRPWSRPPTAASVSVPSPTALNISHAHLLEPLPARDPIHSTKDNSRPASGRNTYRGSSAVVKAQRQVRASRPGRRRRRVSSAHRSWSQGGTHLSHATMLLPLGHGPVGVGTPPWVSLAPTCRRTRRGRGASSRRARRRRPRSTRGEVRCSLTGPRLTTTTGPCCLAPQRVERVHQRGHPPLELVCRARPTRGGARPCPL